MKIKDNIFFQAVKGIGYFFGICFLFLVAIGLFIVAPIFDPKSKRPQSVKTQP